MHAVPPRSRTWAWVLVAALAICLAPGRMALTDPDEARYAQTSREMLRGGDLLVPRFDGAPRLSKPPLIHWAQAAAFLVLGESELSARLPSLLAALATLFLTAWWAERRLGAGTGGPAAMALSTCLIFFVCARLAIIDMLLCLFVTAALLAWEAATAPDARRHRALAWAGAAAIGLAALAKGPVGPALAASIVAVCALAARRRITPRGAAMAAAGILAIAGPWVIALTHRVGAGILLDLMRREMVERSVFGLDHPRPLYWYALTFWPAFLPWSIAVPVALAWRMRAGARPKGADLLLLCWVGVTLVFFSLPADKNDAWLLPAAPALALLAARWLPRRAVLAVSALSAALLAAAALWLSEPIARDRSLRDLVVSARLSEGGEVIAYEVYRPSLVWYSGHPVRWAASGRELRRLLDELPGDAPVAIVMQERRLPKLRDGPRAILKGFRPAGSQAGLVVMIRAAQPP